MTGILRKVLPFGDSVRKNKDDEGFSVEYSIALEYNGPPVAHNIPRALPVVVGEIPTADALPLWSGLLDTSLPVIQPIKKAHPGENGGGWKFEVVGLPRNSEDSNAKFESSMSIESEGSPRSDKDETSDDSSSSCCCLNKSSIPRNAKRPSAVSFGDPDSVDTFNECSVVTDSEGDTILGKPKAQNSGKKGSCYHCQRGSRFTRKEVCLVCDAKYCYRCLLRAMGSMPEGRKCLLCAGFRIAESKRDSLGKCSRMMKRLLPEHEIKRIMRLELSCAANQLSPKLVFVNNRPLDKHKLLLLQQCANPPKNLTPGYYWYDRVAGFWGKAGQKPCQIISEQLNIGGHLERDASNGNTDVLINNREITKEELWMLTAAGISCRGKPHFWVSPDGSYQEEGQNKAKGKIWETAKSKIMCRILSLPYPSDTARLGSGEVKKNDIDPIVPRKLLLIGYENSGTSTIFKQTKISCGDPFTEEERRDIKLVIQSKLYCYLGILMEARERFQKESLCAKEKGKSIVVEYEPGDSGCGSRAKDKRREKGKGLVIYQSRPTPPGKTNQKEAKQVYAISPKLKASSDWLLGVIAAGNIEDMVSPASREYSALIDQLWKDEAIQATYNRRNELENLPRVATYFLERAMEILKEDYEPSDMDILYAEGISSSNGVVSTNFSFPKLEVSGVPGDTVARDDDLLSYRLIRVHPNNLGENCKWLEMFEDVDIVLFCVSLTDYDEFLDDDIEGSTNKMLASRNLFQKIVTHPLLHKKDFLLLLNKFDLFEEKIERVSLTKCEWFHDFNPVISHNHCLGDKVNGSPSLAQRAFHYIAVKFKWHFKFLTDRRLYVSLVTGLEQDTVKESLVYAREIINWNEEDITVINEESSTSIDASSS